MGNRPCVLVGKGYWGGILSKYLKDSGFDIEHVFSRSGGLSYEELLDTCDSEVFFICTPVSAHYEQVKKALLAGKHVFCEKMLTGDLKKAEELYEIAAENKKILFTDYIYLYSRSVRKMKELCMNVGRIQRIEADISQYGKFYEDTDVIGNIGVHMLTAAGFLTDFSVPDSIVFRNNHTDDTQIPVNVQGKDYLFDVSLGYFCGSTEVSIRASILSEKKVRQIRTVTDKGEIVFDMMSEPSLKACGADPAEFFYDENNNLNNSLSEFREMIEERDGGSAILNRNCSLFAERMSDLIRRQN